MPDLFTKPIETLTAADVQGLIGWQESLTVEFKGALSAKGGGDDPWLSGGKVGDYARDKLLKEVVAFANTSGGHLVLGVEEVKGPPPTATAIKPIRDCADLAQRLAQMAQHIDPPIPLLLVQGVSIDGSAGIVVIRVPASRAAPHRSPDKECYVRRGTESVPISMREIQDMTIAAGRRGEWMPARLAEIRSDFHEWMRQPSEPIGNGIGIRATAVPASGPLTLNRLFGLHRDYMPRSQFNADYGSGSFTVGLPRNPQSSRAILRGVEYYFAEHDNSATQYLYRDGCVSYQTQMSTREDDLGARVYISWILPCLLNALRGAMFLRKLAQAPESEYAVEIEIDSRPRGPVALHNWGVGYQDSVGILPTPLLVPPVGFGDAQDALRVAGALLTDIQDAAGNLSSEPMSFTSFSGL